MSDPIRYAGPGSMRLDEAGAAEWGRRDIVFRIPLSRNLALAILASLLLHLLILFAFRKPPDTKIPIHAQNLPMDVQLAPLVPHVREAVRVPHAEKKRVIAVKKSLSRPHPEAVVPESKPVPEPLPAPPVPKMSFLDYVNAARQRRDAASSEYPKKPLPMGPFPDGGKPPQGTSGIFRIIRMDDNSAEFSFLGWHSEFSNSRKEVFDVDAGADGDIRHAVVRKMIEIIRRYYRGDFNWESERLGGVVVLSARLGDDRELEAFLMKEFFGPRPD